MDSIEDSLRDTGPQRDLDPAAAAVSDVNDVEMGNSDDEGMPALQDVSDSSDDEYNDSDDDNDNDNEDNDRDEPMTNNNDNVSPIPTPPPRPNPNRRTRMEDDADDERDRRHPSQRTNQTQAQNQTPRWHGHPLPGGGFAFHFDATPTTARPTGTDGPGLSIPINEFITHLNLTLQSSLLPETEDPERAKFLVDALEVAPPGLVRRLERVGTATADFSGSGGDSGCAICWEKLLLDNRAEQEEERKIVSMPCAHVFHAECLIPWFSRPRQTTCPTCRFDIDPEGLTRKAPTRRQPAPEEQRRTQDLLGEFVRDIQTRFEETFGNRDGTGAAPAQDPLPFPLVPPRTQPTTQPQARAGQAAAAPQQPQPQSQQQPAPAPVPPQPIATPQPQLNSGQQTPGQILAAIGEQMSRNLATPPATPGAGPNEIRLGEAIQRLLFATTGRNPNNQGNAAAPNPNPFATNAAADGPAPSGDNTTTENAVPNSSAPTAPPPPPLQSQPTANANPNPPPTNAPQTGPQFPFPFPPFRFGPGAGAGGQGGPRMGVPLGIGIGVGLPFPFGPGAGAAVPPLPTRGPAGGSGDGEDGDTPTMSDIFAPLFELGGGGGEGRAGGLGEGGMGGGEDEQDPHEHEHILSFGFDVVINPTGPPEDEEDDGPPVGWDIVDSADAEGAENGDGERDDDDNGPPPLERIPDDLAPHGNPTPTPIPPPPPPAAQAPGGTGNGPRARRIPIPFLLSSRLPAFVTAGTGIEVGGGPIPTPRPPRGPARREKKEWSLPLAPGLTLRQKVEKREREMGLRCWDFCCAVGPHDDDPVPADEGEKEAQISILGAEEGKPICEHTLHPSCLVSSSRISSLSSFPQTDADEEHKIGEDGKGEVEVSCPVCKHVGVVSRSVWEGGAECLA